MCGCLLYHYLPYGVVPATTALPYTTHARTAARACRLQAQHAYHWAFMISVDLPV